MKYDRSKAFPHPVLRPDNDDYISAELQFEPRFMIGSGLIQVSCKLTCSSEDLLNLIARKDAQYVIVASCRDTFYRQTVCSEIPTLDFCVSTDDVRGEFRIDAFIVARSHVSGFRSDDFNKEYGLATFDFDPGDVLAQDVPAIWFIEREVFKPVTAAIELVSDSSVAQNEWKVDLSQHRVRLKMNPNQKQIIDRVRSNREARAILLNSVYFAAVQHAVQALKNGDVEYELRWVAIFNQQILNHKLDVVSEDAYVITQRLLQGPLSRLLHDCFDRI